MDTHQSPMSQPGAEVPAWSAELTLATQALRRAARDLDQPGVRYDVNMALEELEAVLAEVTAPLRKDVPRSDSHVLAVLEELPEHVRLNPDSGDVGMVAPGKLTERELRAVAHEQLSWWPHQWRLLDEVSERTAGVPGRRIDLLALRPTLKPGWGAFQRLAIEIKTSRSDFLADRRDVEKQQAWRRLCHGRVYLAPAGLIRPDELPADSGLLEVFQVQRPYRDSARLVLQCTVPPPLHAPKREPAWLLHQLMYRATSWELRAGANSPVASPAPDGAKPAAVEYEGSWEIGYIRGSLELASSDMIAAGTVAKEYLIGLTIDSVREGLIFGDADQVGDWWDRRLLGIDRLDDIANQVLPVGEDFLGLDKGVGGFDADLDRFYTLVEALAPHVSGELWIVDDNFDVSAICFDGKSWHEHASSHLISRGTASPASAAVDDDPAESGCRFAAGAIAHL